MATVALERDGSATVQHPLDRVLAAAADAGFRGVALDWFTLRAAERAGSDASAVADRVRALGLVVTDLSALGLGADASTDERVSASMARRCAALGIPLCALVLGVPPSPAVDDRIARVGDVFAASGVRLALEFVPYSAVRTLAEARAVCGRIGHERCGVLVDTWHLARSGGTPADLADLAPSEIACVQLADAAPEAADDPADESRRSRRLPGDGVVDFGAVAAELTKAGYDGPLGTEVLDRRLAAQLPEAVAEACFRAASTYFPA
ncbi:sugar phosphate isomerase/epimerase [Blastococcus sp. CT_GayMR20]|uniref:sugar phosphate isomerase/epimerase family protein n=1 Tax=Blastococcus sp. CT_GayMR20 TaxID=2559609 RepID=UPI0010740B23|nr:sugar phosphate isomerase/epimerase family protein [Blastococcus sp. CT_GayMR20]TFV81225.1 sugar phosphate isomerase/epimerase [Blastococcus sp. CT_GayMR20]